MLFVYYIFRLWDAIPFIAWLIQLGHLVCDMWLYKVPRMPADSVAWALLYTYTVYALMPMRLGPCLGLSLAIAFSHLLVVGVLPRPIDFTENQVQFSFPLKDSISFIWRKIISYWLIFSLMYTKIITKLHVFGSRWLKSVTQSVIKFAVHSILSLATLFVKSVIKRSDSIFVTKRIMSQCMQLWK